MNFTPMTGTVLKTLGSLSLQIDGKDVPLPSTQKARALLVYLLMRHGKDVNRESLLEMFWPDSDPERARQSLKTATWSIRRGFRQVDLDPDDVLDAGKSTLRWNAPVEIDAERFAALASSSKGADAADAVALYQGDFLESSYEDWVVGERERLSSLYERALAAALAASSDPELARRLVARNPYSEEAWCAIIEAEIQAGRPFSARLMADRCRAALSEVGAAPSKRLEKLTASLAVAASPSGQQLTIPLVGRDAELAELSRRFAECAAGQGSTSVVFGEPGIGKTTLLDGARRVAATVCGGVVSVRAVPQDPRTFGAWTDLFSELCGAPFAEFAQTAGTSIVARLAEEICANLPGGAAIIVDDAHDLSGDAWSVLPGVANLAAARGHAVVISSRPEGLERLRSALGAERLHELQLGPLPSADVAAALEAVLDGVDRAFCDQLSSRSGGNPLFLIALLRSLESQGVVTRDGARWRATSPNDRLALPDTLRRSIQARLRERGDDAADFAIVLALDPEAPSDDIAAVLDIGEERALDAIDDLIALGLIVQPERGVEFAFSHALVREAAAVLPNAARRAHLHRRLAARLSSSAERDAPLRRARHFEAAGLLLDAARSYADSAVEALEWFALQDARSRASRGLHLIEAIGDDVHAERLRAELSLLVARALGDAGDDRDALIPVNDAIRAAQTVGDTQLLMRCTQLKAVLALNCHEIDDCVETATEACALASAVRDDGALARSLGLLSSAYNHLADEARCLDAGRRALEAARRSERPDGITAAADTLLRAQVTYWRFADALATGDEGLAAARRSGWLSEAAMRFTYGALFYYMGDLGRAERELHRARSAAEDDRGEHRWLISLAGLDRLKLRFFTMYMLGVVAAARERWPEVLAIVQPLASEHLYATSYMVRNNIINLWVEALLATHERSNHALAARLAAQLQDDAFEQGSILDLSSCVALTRARVAARLHTGDSAQLLVRAEETVTRLAALRPLVCDLAFTQLGLAAADAGDDELAQRAQARAQKEQERRLTVAGVALSKKDPGLGEVGIEPTTPRV